MGCKRPQSTGCCDIAAVGLQWRRFERYWKEHVKIWATRLELESLRRTVPEGPQADRLLRYEAALSREIERTLNQLERTQRMRLGQPVPPPINLNITASKE